MEILKKVSNNSKMKQVGILIVLLITSFDVYAQNLPIEIINRNIEYHYNDSFDVEIFNKDSTYYKLMVGIEKYIPEFDLWEEVTGNVLMSKPEIEGKAKGGIGYYLNPLSSVKINIQINRINIPFLTDNSYSVNDLSLRRLYRLSASKDIEHRKVLFGEFRFSIKVTESLYQEEYMVIKTTSFSIIK
jgi:hypothetical protein